MGVRVLGSTTSTTVCNSETTGKIMLVAAGSKVSDGGGLGVSIGTSMNVRSVCGGPSVLSGSSCTGFDSCIRGTPGCAIVDASNSVGFASGTLARVSRNGS